MRILIFALLLFCGVEKANAYCSEPDIYESPPEPPSGYHKPTVPYCLSSYSWQGSHECDRWELDQYFNEVEEYTRKLQRYLSEVQDYESAVQSYVDDAIRYARCEADEVAEQHE